MILFSPKRKIFHDYSKSLKKVFNLQLAILILFFLKTTYKVWDIFFDLINPQRRIVREGKMPITRILVIEIDLIGDVVWATPVIRALRERYVDAHIDFMIGSGCRDIVKNNPYINGIKEFNVTWFGQVPRRRGIVNWGITWFKNLMTMIVLVKERYDLVIDLRGDPKTIALSFFTGAPLRVGYNNRTKNNHAAFLLTHPVAFPWENCHNIHIVQHNLNLVATLGAIPGSKAPYIYTDKESETKIERFLEEHSISPKDVLIGIHPGASRVQKRWKTEGFVEVADKIIDKYKAKVIITGSSEEVDIAYKIKSLMKGEPVISSGRLNLLDFVALLKRIDLVITNETATISLASAVKTPVISLMSGMPGLYGPYEVESTVLLKELPCRNPVFEHCICDEIPYRCLNSIEPEEVLEAVDNHLRYRLKFC